MISLPTMNSAIRYAAATICLGSMMLLMPARFLAQAIDVYELADYRLTSDVFERFVKASNRIGDVIREDSSFRYAPLFTRDVALSGDAVAAAAGLAARLENHKALAAALDHAQITPREYTKFAITLIAAHLAHGFLASGVLPRVPGGAPTINVEFVKAHEADVTAVLTTLDIRD